MPVDPAAARILFVSDTHLGFDLPRRPRVTRRRRGPDFFHSFERALAPARRGEVDVVVHGGDVLFRSRVPPDLVDRAFRPLREVADQGVPVCVVPGNHERSRIPHVERVSHPAIHIFDRPRTIRLSVGGLTLGVAGFPFVREVRQTFPSVLAETGWAEAEADARILLLHHAVEGATVGAHDFTFREGADVIRGRAIPEGVAAVLAGHIHRHQVLTRDLEGRTLGAPVLYAGSTERTSFAERGETKGCLLVEVEADGSGRGQVRDWRFLPLPTRPMVQVDMPARRLDESGLGPVLEDLVRRQHPEAVVRLRIRGRPTQAAWSTLKTATAREVLPPTMNLSVRLDVDPQFRIET